MLGDRKEYDAKLKSIPGIIFVDVPSRGMDITSLKPMVDSGANQPFIMTLEHGHPLLEHLSSRFFEGIDWNLDIVAFYVMQKTQMPRRNEVHLPYRNTRTHWAVH